MSAASAQLPLRAAAFGLVGTSLATLGHWAASAHVPGLLPWAGFAVLVALLVLPLLRRERRWLTIVAALALVQLGLHAAFTSSFGGGEHVHPAGGPPAPAWPMLAVHAAAVLASAWWLRLGEAALWRRLRRVAVAALRLVERVRPPQRLRAGAPEPTVAQVPAQPVSILRPLIDRISHRGPPARRRSWSLASN